MKRFGWKKQRPDNRDLKFTPKVTNSLQTVHLSYKYKMGVIYDQGNLGSCVSNAVAFLVHFDLMNKHDQNQISSFIPSRLFIYYYGRVMEGTVGQDSGLEVRDGIKVINQQGVPNELLWPYDITKFVQAPPQSAVDAALGQVSITYKTVGNTSRELLVGTLLAGYPIAFGMNVYESFMSDQVATTGVVPMPAANEQIEGGHCMVIVGYNADTDSFVVRNSWGTNWGWNNGYCLIPSAYLTSTSLASDFWIITEIK